MQQRAHSWARLDAHSQQIISAEKGRDDFRLVFEFFGLRHEEFIDIEHAMRTQTIQAMQFQFERKSWAHEEPPQGGFAHLRGVLELHVTTNGLHNFVDLLARKTK